jgi:putative glutathione S-transferase
MRVFVFLMDLGHQTSIAHVCGDRCGFAQEQDAYEDALENLFSTLDMLEGHLGCSRYLCGSDVTLADIRLFTTLYRFDPVYHILFKCSKRKISEYPNLYGYLKDLYQVHALGIRHPLFLASF